MGRRGGGEVVRGLSCPEATDRSLSTRLGDDGVQFLTFSFSAAVTCKIKTKLGNIFFYFNSR